MKTTVQLQPHYARVPVVAGSWLERFILSKQRTGRVKEVSIMQYVYQLDRFQKQYGVNLETSTVEEIQVRSG